MRLLFKLFDLVVFFGKFCLTEIILVSKLFCDLMFSSDMKQSDWVRWRQLSNNARLLDTNLQACDCVKRGWFNCDCEERDFQRWDKDFLYQRRFQPRPVRPVNKNGAFVATRNLGRIEGPFLYTEWLEYSYFLFDLCHDIMDNKKQPDWSLLYFRHENDFYGGIYADFYQIAFLMIHKLEGLANKHGASNDFHRGVDLYETLQHKSTGMLNEFRKKGEMYTIPRPHREFCSQIHKISPSSVNVVELNKEQIQLQKLHKSRLKSLKKENRKRSAAEALHFLPEKSQNFDSWYPKIKQTPVWFEYKSQTWKYPPIIDTNPEIERAQSKLIEKTIEKWLSNGAIIMMDSNEKPDLCTPVVLANVQLPGGPVPDENKKERMCHDGGYEKAIEGYSFPCKLEDLYGILQVLEKGDLLSKSDDKSGFHLVLLGQESRLLTAFSYQGHMFMYRVAPFGSPKIPAVFQRANLVSISYARCLGVKNNLYLDDRLVIDNDKSMINGVPRNSFVTAALVIAKGGFISLQKSDFNPKMAQDFLGLRLDTDLCTISVPPEKWKRFKEMLSLFLEHNECTFKELEKLRGKCVSFILCNPMTKLFIRCMNRTIAYLNRIKAVGTFRVRFDAELRAELEQWLKLDFLKMKHCWNDNFDTKNVPHRLTFTDASSFSASAVVFCKNGSIFTRQWFFDEETQPLPIYVKESLAIIWMIEEFQDELRGTKILHFCDNQNVTCTYNSYGSRTVRLQRLILKIYEDLKNIRADMTMYWINTHDQIADEPSRFIDWNEEFYPKILWAQDMNSLGVFPTVDCFASEANFKCEKWINFGLSSHEKCIGFDFFSMNPDRLFDEILYIFPPKNLLTKVIAHIVRYYTTQRMVLVYHQFNEVPMAIPKLTTLKTRDLVFREPRTIIPAEFQLKIENQLFYGFWNRKPKALKLVAINC